MRKSLDELASLIGSSNFDVYLLEITKNMSRKELECIRLDELMPISARQVYDIYDAIDFRGLRGFVVDGTINRGFGYKVIPYENGTWALIYSDRDGNNELGIYASKSEARMGFIELIYKSVTEVFEGIRNKRLLASQKSHTENDTHPDKNKNQ